MLDIILEVIFTPNKVWAGTLIGILIATGIWFLVPSSDIKSILIALSIMIGFLIGLVSYFPNTK